MYTENRSDDKQDERTATKTLEVTVSARPGAPQPIDPETITLDDSVLRVIWRCPDLPRDARLQIGFRGDPRGPFFILDSAGSEVTGWGNRGPEETEEQYIYEVRIQAAVGIQALGGGTLNNKPTKPIHPPPTTTYDPPGPPDRRDS